MKALIVFYSRTGVTRKAAETLAACLAANGVETVTEEILDQKERGGVLGGLVAGKDAWTKKAGTIKPLQANVGSFDVVVIGTPVWVWTATPAARAFCEQHAKSCAKVAFFCTMGGSGAKGTFKALEELCGKPPVGTMVLVDREVKRDDGDRFVAAVETFARAIANSAKR